MNMVFISELSGSNTSVLGHSLTALCHFLITRIYDSLTLEPGLHPHYQRCHAIVFLSKTLVLPKVVLNPAV